VNAQGGSLTRTKYNCCALRESALRHAAVLALIVVFLAWMQFGMVVWERSDALVVLQGAQFKCVFDVAQQLMQIEGSHFVCWTS
jgi:hypothetical protein